MEIWNRIRSGVNGLRANRVLNQDARKVLDSRGEVVLRVGNLPPVSYREGDGEAPDIDGLTLRAGLGARVTITMLGPDRREVSQVSYEVSPANIQRAEREIEERRLRSKI